MVQDIGEQALRLIASDRVRAHNTLFKHRHDKPTAPFQREMIIDAHSAHPRIIDEAFRKAAKSTIIVEEATIIQACLGSFRNALVIGASYDRACERLESMKHEFETNEDLEQLFGILRTSDTWATDKVVLANGVCLQAKGAGQSLRGVKHLQYPPDYVLIDDLEDEESTRTPASRQQLLRWVQKTLISALTVDARIRMVGNRLDPEAVIVTLANDSKWLARRYPIKFMNKKGEWEATWPEAFPLDWCDDREHELRRLGLFEDWNQEYMCEADTPEARIFRPEHFTNVLKPRLRTWEPTYIMVDPARSVGKRSATTAMAVFSWVNSRLVVWDCRIGQWLPDEIVEQLFALDEEYSPVALGVEEDALNQFILQPLRQAMVKRGRPLPLRAMSAKKYTMGRGKEDFIKSLQPFFAAGEVEFAKPLPELEAQFKSFPKGTIDGPNALAYALKMRPGAALYDDFSRDCIVTELPLTPLLPVHLILNATSSYATAILLQHDGRQLRVIADWLDEGDPGQIAAGIVRRAQLEAGPRYRLKVTAPPRHFDQWRNIGLQAALSRVQVELQQGGDPLSGREEVRTLLRSSVKGLPAVQVAHAARWTLNAFSGGYCRALGPSGAISEQPEENLYATLMAGLESFCAITRLVSGLAFSDDDNVRVARDGRTLYKSAMIDRR